MAEKQKKRAENHPSFLGLPYERNFEVNNYLSKISDTQFFCPDNDPKEEWKLFTGKNWFHAKSVAEKAAKDSGERLDNIMNSGLNNMRLYAKGLPREDSLQSVRNAAGEEVLESVNMQMHILSLQAALDASNHAELIATKDLNFPHKDIVLEHSERRKEVWDKGYGLYGEINGVLYVYCPDSTERMRAPIMPSIRQDLPAPRDMELMPV